MARSVDEAARKRPRSRLGWIVLGSVGVLVVAALAALGYLQHVAGNRLRAAIAEAERDDPRWTLGDLEASRKAVAVEENSALRAARVARLLGTWPNGAPATPGEEKGAPRGGELWQAVVDFEADAALSHEMEEALREELSGVEKALAEARPLAEMGEGRAPLTYAPVVANTLLPHIQESRNVARLLQLDAIARAHADPDGALDDCRAMIGVARSIGDEPFLISQLVRVAVDGAALATIERVLSQGVASEGALAKLERDLARESRTPFALNGLKGERASSFDMMQKLRTGEIGPSQLGGGPPTTSLLGSLFRVGPFGAANQAFLLELMNRAIAITRRPIREQGPLWTAWEAELKPAGTWSQLSSIFAQSMVPAVRATAEAGLRARGQIDAMRVMVATERFRLAEGHWPDRAEELVPRFLPELPDDPYEATPVKLARREDGRTAYIVGPDRADDEGWRDPRNRPVAGTDLGFRLIDPALRHRPPRDLPDDPVRADPTTMTDDVLRDREGRRRRMDAGDLRARHPESPQDDAPGAGRREPVP